MVENKENAEASKSNEEVLVCNKFCHGPEGYQKGEKPEESHGDPEDRSVPEGLMFLVDILEDGIWRDPVTESEFDSDVGPEDEAEEVLRGLADVSFFCGFDRWGLVVALKFVELWVDDPLEHFVVGFGRD